MRFPSSLFSPLSLQPIPKMILIRNKFTWLALAPAISRMRYFYWIKLNYICRDILNWIKIGLNLKKSPLWRFAISVTHGHNKPICLFFLFLLLKKCGFGIFFFHIKKLLIKAEKRALSCNVTSVLRILLLHISLANSKLNLNLSKLYGIFTV